MGLKGLDGRVGSVCEAGVELFFDLEDMVSDARLEHLEHCHRKRELHEKRSRLTQAVHYFRR